MSRRPPRQKPGKSEQVVRTPPELLTAARHLLGIEEFYRDLAASHGNAVADIYYTKNDDGLRCNWQTPRDAWNWLNPEYADIEPWVQKAAHVLNRGSMQRGHTAVLIPASVGSNWWRDHVHEQAAVYFVNGRPTFLDKKGHPICSVKTGKPTPYPKDLALLLYGEKPGYHLWTWKEWL